MGYNLPRGEEYTRLTDLSVAVAVERTRPSAPQPVWPGY
jgi:hypothetical protein